MISIGANKVKTVQRTLSLHICTCETHKSLVQQVQTSLKAKEGLVCRGSDKIFIREFNAGFQSILVMLIILELMNHLR